MTKFEEEFNYLIELSGKVLIGQVGAEVFEKNRVSFFEKYETDQQQALPVVPEDVAKLPPFDDMKEYVLDERLLTIREYLNKLDDKSNSDITEAEAWCMIHEDIVYRAMLDGYTVEKPQLFYLKHIDMSKNDEQVDWYMSKAHRRVGHNACEKRKLPIYDSFKYTQQEIDSMQTGSYEQIEVGE